MSELPPEVTRLRERLAEMQSEVARSKQAEQALQRSGPPAGSNTFTTGEFDVCTPGTGHE